MNTVALGEVAEINPRGMVVRADEPISFVGMAELNARAAVATPLETRAFADVAKGYTVFRNGDLLAAKITPCWENGKVGQARLEHGVGVGSTEFYVVRPLADAHDRYLLHFLRLPVVREMGALRMTGSAGQRRVPVAFLNDLQIPLPSMGEQRRIAAILDHADALRTKRRQVLAHLDALTQSIFHHMFGDPLSRTPAMTRRSIGSVAKVMTGNSPPRSDSTNFGEVMEWIKSDNLGGDIASQAKERLSDRGVQRARVAPAGSVLVTCIAGSPTSIGKASMVDRDVAFNQQINAVIPSPHLDMTFLMAQFKVAPQLVRMKSSAGMRGLVSKSSFESIEILVPSLKEQQDFTARAERVGAHRLTAQRSLMAANELFMALESRAFQGGL